jgi:hypothetical protein
MLRLLKLFLLLTVFFLNLELQSQVQIKFVTLGTDGGLKFALKDSVLEYYGIHVHKKGIAHLKDSVLVFSDDDSLKSFFKAEKYVLDKSAGILYEISSSGREPFLLMTEFNSPEYKHFIRWHRSSEYATVVIQEKYGRKKIRQLYNFWKIGVEVIITKDTTVVRKYKKSGSRFREKRFSND